MNVSDFVTAFMMSYHSGREDGLVRSEARSQARRFVSLLRTSPSSIRDAALAEIDSIDDRMLP
jgi:hypothetical protein